MSRFGTEFLEDTEPLAPLNIVGHVLERELIYCIVDRVLARYTIPQERDRDVRNQVAQFFVDCFGAAYREKCCVLNSLRQDLYEKMGTMNNGARIDLILKALEFKGFEDFLTKQMPAIEERLHAAGIISVSEIAAGSEDEIQRALRL